MSDLVSLWDFEITKGKKLSKKSLVLQQALKELKNENNFHLENYEQVIDPLELILKCEEVTIEMNKYKENTNASK